MRCDLALKDKQQAKMIISVCLHLIGRRVSGNQLTSDLPNHSLLLCVASKSTQNIFESAV